MGEGGQTPLLFVERIVVRQDRLVCDIALTPGAPRNTSPELMRQICAEYPSLSQHACINGVGDTFGVVMENTPIPHLLEHLVVDAQARELSQNGTGTPFVVLAGTTQWLDEVEGKARIEVSFTDDLVALRVLKNMTSFLASMMVPFST